MFHWNDTCQYSDNVILPKSRLNNLTLIKFLSPQTNIIRVWTNKDVTCNLTGYWWHNTSCNSIVFFWCCTFNITKLLQTGTAKSCMEASDNVAAVTSLYLLFWPLFTAQHRLNDVQAFRRRRKAFIASMKATVDSDMLSQHYKIILPTWVSGHHCRSK